jgi:hypothetical protein
MSMNDHFLGEAAHKAFITHNGAVLMVRERD